MTLSLEQFKALRAKGLSTDQIIRFDTEPSNHPNPIGEAIKTTGDILSGGFKRQISSGPVSFNTITGGPATEFAHGVKTAAMVKGGVPELVAEAASGATDPQQILGGILTGSPKFSEMFRNKAESKISSARNLFRKILPSKASEQTTANLKGIELPEVEVGTPLVTKSKDYGELGQKFSGAKKEAITQRHEQLASNFQEEIPDPVNKLTSKLQSRIRNMKNSKRAEPTDIKNLEEILSREQEALIGDTERMTIDKAERIKELYQKEAKPLYKKVNAGTATGNESMKLSAYADLADDAMNLVDELASVSPTNRTIQGAGRAERLAAEQKTAFQQKRPQGIIMELIQALRGGPSSTGAAVIRGHFGREIPLSKTTSKIQKLVGSSAKASELADLLEKIGGSSYEHKLSNKMLMAPHERASEGQLQLPSGQGFELVGEEASRAYRDKVGKTLQPSKQLQLPEYTGPTNVIAEERIGTPRDLKGVSKLPTRQKMTMKELLKRRNNNFK